MVREQQGLMLYAPNDANAAEEEAGRESDHSPTPRAGTSKDSPVARKKKEPVASVSKNAAPGAVADLQAQLVALQAQVKVIAAEKATHPPAAQLMNAPPAAAALPMINQVCQSVIRYSEGRMNDLGGELYEFNFE